jgi:hypothetical protein
MNNATRILRYIKPSLVLFAINAPSKTDMLILDSIKSLAYVPPITQDAETSEKYASK